eukprot:3245564-Alexandrium_andersonii.AAC.1
MAGTWWILLPLRLMALVEGAVASPSSQGSLWQLPTPTASLALQQAHRAFWPQSMVPSARS